MNRRFAACAISTIALVSLAACSGSPSTTTAPPAPPTTTQAAPVTTAPTEKPADQSLASACLAMAGPMADASAAIADAASAATSSNPQSAVDAWTALVDAFGEIKDSATNAELKDAVTLAHKDLASVRDLLKKLYVDKDLSAMSDYTKATADMQASYTALMKLCSS